MKRTSPEVDAYIARFPELHQKKLNEIRSCILETLPEAEELISYGMPAYKQQGFLVYFAGNKNHVGFYPTPSPLVAFADKLEKYTTSKGAVQFPLDQELPYELIREMVRFRLNENLHSNKARK